jgi:hypothetical protein
MNRHAWTGMHEPARMLHAACMNRHTWTGMHEPACMLMQQLLLQRACVRGCLRDRHHVSADLQLSADPGVENRIFV